MPDREPPLDWLAAANRLALIATQLSNLIHETNNILQIIGGNAELLALSALPAAAAQRARAISDQAQRASALLAEILALSREAGTSTGGVDMKAVVERALMLRRFSLWRAQIEVSIEGDPEHPVIGNRQHLLQTMLIVLLNAEEALAGSPDPRLTVRFASAPGLVTVFVNDNAAGTAPDAAAAAKPLALNPESPNRLGIGLTVARYLVEQQGGRIDVAPAVPRGTTVAITLVRAPAEPRAP